MAGYRELLEDYTLNEQFGGVTGVRAFAEVAGGTASLPAINTKFDTGHPSCLLKSRTKKFHSFDGGVKRYKWTCNYETPGMSSGSGDGEGYDEDDRQFQGGGEIITIDDPQAWTWKVGAGKCNQPIFLQNAMGSFTRQVKKNSTAQKNTWIANKFLPYVGKVNSAAWEGWRKGSVLFNSISGGTQYDSGGNQTWVFTCEFLWRVVNGRDYLGALVVENDWQNVFRKDVSGTALQQPYWDIPQTKDAGGQTAYLYGYANLEEVFT